MKLKRFISAAAAFSIFISSAAFASNESIQTGSEVENNRLAEASSGGSGGGSGSIHISDADVTLNTDPEDVCVRFFEENEDETLTEVALRDLEIGNTYKYTASRYGYVSKYEDFTAEETLNITLDPIAELKVYGKDKNNMYFAEAEVPKKGALKWERQLDADNYYMLSEPMYIGDALYVVSSNKVFKLSPETGEILAESDELKGSLDYYGLAAPCYGDGMLFLPVSEGKVQALDINTLASLWVSEPMEHSTATPLTYKDGYVYGGTYTVGSTEPEDVYFCIETTDEDIFSPDETKYASWKVTGEGGFYFAGAYINDTAAVFGSDSGKLYSVNTQSGDVISTVDAQGHIRSSVSYCDGRVYFTTTDKYFCSAALAEDGTLSDLKSLLLPGAATGTPAVYNGYAYVGTGQGEDESFKYVIIDIADMEIAAQADIPGYAQREPLISVNGDKISVYTSYNKEPGGIYNINVDTSSDTVTAEGSDFFVPEHSNYCLSNIICGPDGALYYKNDSGYIYAVTKPDEDKALEQAKTNALAKIDLRFGEFSKSDYSSSNYEDLQNAYETGKKNINAAESVSDVTEALNNAIDAMLSVSCSSGSRATVYVSVEKFNIGQGYIKEPVELSVKKYTTAAQVLNAAMKDKLIYSGSLTNSFYLSAVSDNDLKLAIPAFIKEAVEITSEERSAKGYLSEFDYTSKSGWVYTVNGKLPDVAASDYLVKNGDIIRFQFSLTGYGTDIYSSNEIEGYPKLYDLADKDALTKQIAIVNGYSDFSKYMNIQSNKRAYDNALEIAKKPTATAKEVKQAEGELERLEKPKTSSSSSSTVSGGTGSSVTKPSTVLNQNTNNTVSTGGDKNVFTDITNHWAKDYIYKLYDKKVITGRTETTFDPDAQLTRAECTALLSRIANADLSKYSAAGRFGDVQADDWYNSAVGWAVEAGITAGMSETEFAPSQPITREQFVVMLTRFAAFMNIELKEVTEAVEFSDRAGFSQYAADSITAAQRAGIISGRDGNIFAPGDYTTRAETAKMLSYFVN